MASSAADISFVPCVEDRLSTCTCRHLEVAQNVLFMATRTAARALTSSSAAPTATSNAALEEAYQALWRGRGEVPEGLRKEWFEVALTLLSRQNPPGDARGWYWWVAMPAPTDSAADARHEEGRPRKERSSRWKPWTLWEDTRRQLTFLTLRVAPSSCVVPPGVHLKLDAMRPEDVLRLDGPAFHVRTRLLLRCQDLVSQAPHHVEQEIGGGVVAPQPAYHVHEAEMCAQWLHRVVPSALPGVCASSPGNGGAVGRGARMTCAVLRYRVLVELCALRLTHNPRCVVTWNLLVDSLQYMRKLSLADGRANKAAWSAEQHSHHQLSLAVTHAVIVYTTAYIIPYLKLRDRHVEGLHGSFHAVSPHVFGASCAARGLWDSVVIHPDNCTQEDTTAAVGVASSPDLGVGETVSAFVVRHRPDVTSADEQTALCAEALVHVALAAAGDGLHSAASLEDVAHSSTEENREALSSVLAFTGGDRATAADEAMAASEDAAALFVSSAARQAALRRFLRRFYSCAVSDALERGGVPRDV